MCSFKLLFLFRNGRLHPYIFRPSLPVSRLENDLQKVPGRRFGGRNRRCNELGIAASERAYDNTEFKGWQLYYRLERIALQQISALRLYFPVLLLPSGSSCPSGIFPRGRRKMGIGRRMAAGVRHERSYRLHDGQKGHMAKAYNNHLGGFCLHSRAQRFILGL